MVVYSDDFQLVQSTKSHLYYHIHIPPPFLPLYLITSIILFSFFVCLVFLLFFCFFFFFTSMPESFYYVRTQLCYPFFFLFSSVVALSCCYPGQSSRMLCRFAIHIFYSEWKILLTYFIFMMEIFHLGSSLLDE